MVWPGLGAQTRRYSKGRYALYGSMYLRWWFTDQILRFCGRGIFKYHSSLLPWYYRLLGARIGSNVSISNNADLGEYDLLYIGDDVCIDDKAILRPFVAHQGAMVRE